MCKMEAIANMLGVELGEEFYLVREDGLKEHRCRLTETGMERMTAGEWGGVSGLIEKALMGDYTVEPVEWKPKVGEAYYTFFQDNWAIRRVVNKGTFESALKIRSGVAFRTREEAFEARPTVYEMLTGKKWEERA